MNEAIKNLIVLMWTMNAINVGADTQVVTKYSFAEEKTQTVSYFEEYALKKISQEKNKKTESETNNT